MGLRRALLVWRLDLLAAVAARLLRSPLFYAWCRRFPRLATIAGMRVVAEHAEAKRVLAQDRSFGVIYLERMERLQSPFLLGFDRSPPHDGPRRALYPALSGRAIADLYRDSMAAAQPVVRGAGGRVELVHQLTDPVLSATVGAHLGTGTTSRRQLDAARLVFRDIFINPKGNPDVSEPAVAAAAALRSHVRACVRDRQAELDRGAAMRRDVLGRVLDAQRANREPFLTDEQAVTQITGLLVAWVASISRGMAFALDALLDSEEGVSAGREAALAGERGPVWAVLQEAMRLQPPVPGIERRCLREGPLPGGRIAREKELVLLTGAAMRDAKVFPHPRRFDPSRVRDEDASELLLGFGHGVHKCLGLWVSEQQMTAIATALLVRPNLRKGSKLKFAGPYPDRLDVVFDPV
ncbi:cytochrome P450 [Candidatus Solirubrobacter pratensis]|uniref:cytochrome P450 n=1 Tax=Candidatus Solirubrobacter pratensis TaxID=1298857 RepID=UPI00041D56E5|nr:cytochrome P450 [Candidatus Solirubrobacter pratensis]